MDSIRHRTTLSLCAALVLCVAANTAFGYLDELVTQVSRSDPTDQTLFGDSIAVAGNLLVVGAGTYTYETAPGSAYVYDFSDPQNIIETRLFSPTANAGTLESFARSVAVSGNWVFVGAPNVNGDAGLVHMYDVSDPLNVTHRAISAFDSAPQNRFGQSLAVDGNRLIVGAPDYSASVTHPPAVYVLDISDPDNILQSKIVPDPDNNVGRFGDDVDIEGDFLIVGDTGIGPRGTVGQAGGAYLYDLNDPAHMRSQLITPADPSVTYAFGRSVAISGTKAVVGAVGDVGPVNPPGSSTGTAYFFDFSNWDSITQIEFGGDDLHSGSAFGGNSDVELFGDIAVVGSKNDGSTSGSVYVFDVSNSANIVQLSKVVAPDPQSSDRFGSVLSFDGRTLAVATRRGGLGAAYLFEVPEPSSFVLLLLAAIASVRSCRLVQ